MTSRCIQLELFPRTESQIREEEIKTYKKEIFNAIRGLYARNSQLKSESDKLQKILKDFFKIDLSCDPKTIVFESDSQEIIQSLIESEREFLNAELLEYKKITDKSLTCLMFKYNESERLLLNIKEVLQGAIFKEMENRAHG